MDSWSRVLSGTTQLEQIPYTFVWNEFSDQNI